METLPPKFGIFILYSYKVYKENLINKFQVFPFLKENIRCELLFIGDLTWNMKEPTEKLQVGYNLPRRNFFV